MKLEFTILALRDLSHLPKKIAARIMTKMEWYAAQQDPLSFGKPLKDVRLGNYRFRVGDYRVIVDVQHSHISVLLVLAVRHRKDAYRL